MSYAAIIGAVAALGAAYAGYRADRKNRRSQEEQNRRDTQNQWDMYWTERDNAVKDFSMTNQYNSPEEQMNRLRQAGLNPNLVYGKGAENTASMIRGSNASRNNQPAPRYDSSFIQQGLATGANLASSLGQIKMQGAQTDNLYQQNALIAAQTSKTHMETATSEFELGKAKELRDESIMAAKLANEQTRSNIEKTEADTTFTLDSNERQKLSNTSNIAKTTQDILESRVRVKTMELKNEMNPAEREKLEAEIYQLMQMTQNAREQQTVIELEAEIKDAQAKMIKQGVNPNSKLWELTIYKIWERLITPQ